MDRERTRILLLETEGPGLALVARGVDVDVVLMGVRTREYLEVIGLGDLVGETTAECH